MAFSVDVVPGGGESARTTTETTRRRTRGGAETKRAKGKEAVEINNDDSLAQNGSRREPARSQISIM